MTISKKLKKYLDKEGVPYETKEHPLAYTAQEVAGSQHVPGKQMIKTVLVKESGTKNYLMCVVTSVQLIDFDKLQSVTGKTNLELADESEISELFPEYEIGAEPPFGHLYDLKTYCDHQVSENEEVVFNAGTHTDVVKIAAKHYFELAEPEMADIGRHI